MKPSSWVLSALVVVTVGVTSDAVAHLADETGGQPVPNPAGHAPAGVLFEHMHKQGQGMVGYRFAQTEHVQLFGGSDKISDVELSEVGFTTAPHNMSMQMHMLDVMYAPADWLNLMFMPQFMSMDMLMTAADANADGDHHHAGMVGSHGHRVLGLGDTVIAALIRIPRPEPELVHFAVAVSVPTGSVVETGADGRLLGYGMQLGSGTWDLLPSLTYSADRGNLSWGAQLGGTLRLQAENESGFRFGNRHYATGWTAYRPAPWASLSLRLQHEVLQGVRGHYHSTHSHSSPADLQDNYGGRFLHGGLGANFVAPSGFFAGQRLGLEWLRLLRESYSGYQLGGGDSFVLNWSTAF